MSITDPAALYGVRADGRPRTRDEYESELRAEGYVDGFKDGWSECRDQVADAIAALEPRSG